MIMKPRYGIIQLETQISIGTNRPLKNPMNGDRATFARTGSVHIRALTVIRCRTFLDHLRAAFLRLRSEEKVDWLG